MSCCARDEISELSESKEQSRLVKQTSIKWRIRSMRHDDIEKCLEIWRQVELTEAHLTVASALTTDPAGFHVAELESSGVVIGMCSGTMTREDTAFMGFYAVDPAFQGIGIGRELWAKTVSRLDGAMHNIGLYGVPSMSEKYKKSGFKLEDSVRMLIYESRPGEQLLTSKLKHMHGSQDSDHEDSCWRLEVINGRTSAWLIKRLIDFDERINKHSRERLLRNYLTDGPEAPLTVAIVRNQRQVGTSGPSQSPIGERKSSCCLKPSQEAIIEGEALSTSVKSSLSISAINNISSELHLRSSSPIDIPSVSAGAQQQQHQISNHHHHIEIIGYGCIRHDNTGGAMIGPIYARTPDAYEVILRELVERFDIKLGGKYSAMSLTSNEYAGKMLEQIGFEELDQCSRMFTKFVPEALLDQVFLVHSPNFTLF